MRAVAARDICEPKVNWNLEGGLNNTFIFVSDGECIL